MAEEVKIRVVQESQGTALKDAQKDLEHFRQKAKEQFPETASKIWQSFQKAAAGYEQKGFGDLAKSARGDAATLQGDLDRSAKEQLKAHQEQVKAQKVNTAEMREQNAVLKARESHAMRFARTGARVAERLAGDSPLSGMTSAVGAVGGLPAIIVAALAVTIAGVAASYGRRLEGAALLGVEDRSARAMQGRHLRRQAGFEGSAASNRELAESLRDDQLAAMGERGAEDEKKKWRWLHPTKWISSLTGEEDAKTREIDARIKRDAEGAKQADVQKRQKYAEQVAPLIEAQRQLNLGHAGESRALEDKVARIQEVNRLKREGAHDDEANAGADVKMATIARERAGSFAKSLDARAGAAEIAQVARLAARFSHGEFGGGGAEQKLDQIHRALHEQTGLAAEAFRAKFSRRS